MKFSLTQLTQQASLKGLCVVDVFVTPSLPPDARLSPPFSPCQEGTHLHLHILAHFAECTACITDSEVIDPTSKRSVDLRYNFRQRGCPVVLNDVAHLGLDCLASFLLRSHLKIMAVPLALAGTAQVESQEPKGFPFQRVHHLGFLLVQLDAERRELLMEPLQGSFSLAGFGMVAAGSDDDIIGEPMIVHCLVGSLCRLAAYRVEGPIQLVQIDIRSQWTERTFLRNPDLSSNLDNLLHKMQDLRVLDPLRDFV